MVGMEVGDGMVMLRLKMGIWSGLERRLDGMGLGMRGRLGREVGLDVGMRMRSGLERSLGFTWGYVGFGDGYIRVGLGGGDELGVGEIRDGVKWGLRVALRMIVR